ncbi:MAG: polyprenyl diphosphate synthase [Candidatus Babeliales bacterium]
MNHLAVIMDGNRRWARQRGKFPWYGHRAGVEAVHRVTDFCLKKKISYLSLYAFSIENFNRDPQEYSYLFQMIVDVLGKEVDSFIKAGIRVCFVGDRSLFPAITIPAVEETEKKTADCAVLTVNILFCYGGQQEILEGVRSIVREVQAGRMQEDQLSLEAFKKHLWLQGCPPPDLVIRTGGINRLSNFLLFHMAYSELYFLDCLWPDINETQLTQASDYFDNCTRNFGA